MPHHGFGDYEYDAVKTFCWHYCLEFPSVPVLQPEFTNPLFLKTLCEGLRESGERRIPKGFHGITETFDRYLSAINARLAKPESLDYDPKNNLVRQALERIAERLAESATRWLPRSDAQNVVNGLLEGRDYSRSLYPAVVAEGILTENMNLRSERPNEVEEVVFITYERFADHVIAYHLLSTHMDANNPRAALAKDGALAFLCESGNYVPYGLIEALCIQAPERTGKELVNLAPEFLDAPSIGSAFLESIIWRKLDAFSDDTVEVLNKLIESKAIREDPLDTLLSVSTVPGHPFNADFLDQRLRQDSMPDRDARWSTYLHRAWGYQGPVDRLVDWASSLSADDDVEDEVAYLAVTTLAWMFTTPNRFLRDRATNALVALLTGRLALAERLVDRFADVDDPYVAERVYAAVYGVAMRSYDTAAVGRLASLVYERVLRLWNTPASHLASGLRSRSSRTRYSPWRGNLH